jgi:hypothetical protein
MIVAVASLGVMFLWQSFAATTNKSADLNNDGKVNLSDLSILLSNYGKNVSQGDINNDGIINLSDLSILLSKFGTTAVIAKRFVSTAASQDLAKATTITAARQALQKFADQYNLKVELGEVKIAPAYQYATLGESDLPALKAYGAIFIDEWAKYPPDWIAATKVKTISFTKQLTVLDKFIAAQPDLVNSRMLYAIDYGVYDYAREGIHHEFAHLYLYNIFGAIDGLEPAWSTFNPSGFSYGNGGFSCYDPKSNCLDGFHPVPGFVTGYATSGSEEDQAEVAGFLMDTNYYHELKGWITTDQNLKQKIDYYKYFLASHSQSMDGSYFDDINP